MFPFLLFRCKKGSSSASRFSVDWLLTVLALVVWVTISSLALAQTREDGQTKSPNFTNHAGDEQARFSAERNDYWRPGRYADAAFTYSKNHDHFLGHHLSAQRKNSVRQGIGDKAGRTAQALGKRITADPWGTAEDLGKGTWNVAKSLGRSTWNAVRHPIESAQSFGQEVLTLGTTAAVNSASGMKSAWAAYRGEENALNALYGQNMGPALMGLGGIQGTLTAAQVIPAAKGAQLIGKGALYAGRKAGEKVLLQLGRKEGMQGVRASGKVAEITLGRGVTNKAVIGKVDDLNAPGALKADENTLLKYLPNQGNPKANWKQNSSVLRQEMNKGNPIRDASVKPNGELRDNTGFLRAERNLLKNKGWTHDSSKRMWSPLK